MDHSDHRLRLAPEGSDAAPGKSVRYHYRRLLLTDTYSNVIPLLDVAGSVSSILTFELTSGKPVLSASALAMVGHAARSIGGDISGVGGGDRSDYSSVMLVLTTAWAEWVAWQLTDARYTVELDLGTGRGAERHARVHTIPAGSGPAQRHSQAGADHLDRVGPAGARTRLAHRGWRRMLRPAAGSAAGPVRPAAGAAAPLSSLIIRSRPCPHRASSPVRQAGQDSRRPPVRRRLPQRRRIARTAALSDHDRHDARAEHRTPGGTGVAASPLAPSRNPDRPGCGNDNVNTGRPSRFCPDQHRVAGRSWCRCARKRTLAAGPGSACLQRMTPALFYMLTKNSAEQRLVMALETVACAAWYC